MSRLVSQLGYALTREFGSVAKPAGLRAVHLKTLIALGEKPITQRALGERLGIDPTRLVVLLNELEAGGFIERHRDSDDRRRHYVALSPANVDRLRHLQADLDRIDERTFSVLSNVEREELKRLLTLVADTQENMPTPIETVGE